MSGLEGLGYRGATVVVTGSYSGMGQATAQILGQLGAHVHCVDLNKPAIAHEHFYATDLSQPEQVDATIAQLRGIGPVHYLFNCAGISHEFGPMKCMLVNYIGTRQLTEGLLSAMVDGSGIAIIASVAGIGWQRNLATNLQLLAISDPHEARRWCEARPEAIRDGYTVSKEMLITWAMHRSVSLGRERHIRINCTGPGPTNTAFMDSAIRMNGREFFERFPYPLLGRAAAPEEQGWPLVLLNSRLNAAVTGTVLYTDQGFAGGLLTGSLDASSIGLK
jgi:NAD(P)-dependent dehydrogenase (short-subunit alcohol dehydrogenase family)